MPRFRRNFSLNLRRNLRFSVQVEAELPGLRETANRLLNRRVKSPAASRQAPPQLPRGPMPVPNRELPEEQVREAIDGVENWYHQIEVAPGITTPGVNPSASSLAAMGVPEDLEGKRVLDVGARDGYFSFVAEARGAEVLAIDAVASHLTGFDTAASLLGSSVEYRTMNVYDLDPQELGTFDAIFFLGVLYHLRDPMLALDRLWSVAKPGAEVWIESHTIDKGFVDPQTKEFRELASVAPNLTGVPMAQFYPDDELMGTVANWWGPNLAALEAMVDAAGFQIDSSRPVGGRGLVIGRKTHRGEDDFYRELDRGTATSEREVSWHNFQNHPEPHARKNLPPKRENGASPNEAKKAIHRVKEWYHRIEVAPGVVTPGTHDSEAALKAMEVPEDLEGKRVLDVGARDGYFSFVAEARGAEVLAIDAVAPHLTGFDTAASLLGSSVEYRTMNVYDLDPQELGTFDAIFFLGVLYHLRDPMLALDRLWEVASPGAEIWLTSHTIDKGFVDPETGGHKTLASVAPGLVDIPVAQFYPGRLLGGDFTNWWGPNLAGLEAMVRSAGFEVGRSRLMGSRGLVVGRKVEDSETIYFRDYDRGVVTE